MDNWIWTDELVKKYVDSIIPPLEQLGRGIFNDITGDRMEKFKREQSVKQKLFTTLDGKDIFYGENCWVVSPEASFGWQPLKVLMNNTPLDERGKYFSTEVAANEYVTMNKPCLSLDDLLSVWADGDMYKKNKEYYADAPLFLNFKKLVNEKINDSNR